MVMMVSWSRSSRWGPGQIRSWRSRGRSRDGRQPKRQSCCCCKERLPTEGFCGADGGQRHGCQWHKWRRHQAPSLARRPTAKRFRGISGLVRRKRGAAVRRRCLACSLHPEGHEWRRRRRARCARRGRRCASSAGGLAPRRGQRQQGPASSVSPALLQRRSVPPMWREGVGTVAADAGARARGVPMQPSRKASKLKSCRVAVHNLRLHAVLHVRAAKRYSRPPASIIL